MPFTPAHAAAALPFRRLRLVLSALVVGTMAPDFEYFIRLSSGGGFGHTFAGAFLLSLPLALAVLWMFHAVVKAPLIELFPDAIRLRLTAHMGRFRFGGPKRFVLIVISTLIGIATHIAWDSLAHARTWPYRHFAVLRARLPVPLIGPVLCVKLVQLGSSIVGVFLLGGWLLCWYRRAGPSRTGAEATMPASRRWLVLGCIATAATLGGVIRGVTVMSAERLAYYRQTVIGDGLATVIGLSWWMLVAYAVVASRRRTASGVRV